MSDFADKSTEELHKELREKRESVRQFRFAVAGSQKSNANEVREERRDIARILTELRKREIAEK